LGGVPWSEPQQTIIENFFNKTGVAIAAKAPEKMELKTEKD